MEQPGKGKMKTNSPVEPTSQPFIWDFFDFWLNEKTATAFVCWAKNVSNDNNR